MEKSLRIGAIVGGVMGGLAVLLAIGFGVCIFFRKRASAWGDQEYSDDIEVSTGAPMSAHGITPFQIQPYVSFFLASCPACVPTDISRTHLIPPHTQPTLMTLKVGNTLQHFTRVVTLVLQSCK